MKGRYKKAVLLLFLLLILAVNAFSQTTYTWEYKDSVTDPKVSEIPIAFTVARTSATDADNVHQVILTFEPGTAQNTGGAGSGELCFTVYMNGLNIIDINTPPINDGNSPFTCDNTSGNTCCSSGCNPDVGYDIILRKVAGEYKWELEIKYKPITGAIWSYGVVPSDEDFILIAKNVVLPSADADGMQSVSASIESRTRQEVIDGDPLGITDVSLDTPPQITITGPTGTPPNPPAYQYTGSAASDTFTCTITDDSLASLTDHKWNDGTTDYTGISGPTYDQIIPFSTTGLHTVTFEVSEPLIGTVSQTGFSYIDIVVKEPPEVTSLTVTSPVTTPVTYGDAPLDVDFSATVDHHDPIPEPNDPDANTTDYTFAWTFDDAGATTGPGTLTPSHQFIETGIRSATLTVTDDYGFSSAETLDVYATPLDTVNFPPSTNLALEHQVPTVDGVVKPTDTDNNGTLEVANDTIEMGWHNCFRISYADGTNDPAAMQFIRPADIAGNPYLYLSFEVNNDPAFDDEDVIVLTFRPDKASAVPADDRRIFIFPVYDDHGAANSDGTGWNITEHVFDKPPRLMEFYENSSSWTECANTGGVYDYITMANTEGDNGFYVRVHSHPGSPYSWNVEIRVPLTETLGGTDWMDLADNFLFYANVIRVADRSVSGDPLEDNSYCTQYRWPKDTPALAGSLAAITVPIPFWGDATKNLSYTSCSGLFLETYSDIGVYDDATGNTLTSVNIAPTGNTDITLVANVHNNSTDTAGNVQVLFRIAMFGAGGFYDGQWIEVPGTAPVPGCSPGSATDPSVSNPSNPTCPASVNASDEQQFFLDWTISDGDYFHDHFENEQDHQCVYAEIVSADTNIIKKSWWNNVHFDVSSKYNDSARIGTYDLGDPPDGQDKHRIILEVASREIVIDNDIRDEKDEPIKKISMMTIDNPDVPEGEIEDDSFEIPPTDFEGQGEGTDSYLEYFITAYYDIGESLVVGENSYKIYEPIGSFGYVLFHDGPVEEWDTEIEGAEKIAEGLYEMEIEPESYQDIDVKVESHEPTRFMASLHGGIAIPLGTLGDAFKPGPNFMFDFGYKILPSLSVAGYFGFNYFISDISGMDNMYIMNISLDAKGNINVNNLLDIYLQAGPTLFLIQDRDPLFGFNGGLGLDFKLSRMITLELGADYFGPFDIDYQFLHSHLGVIFNF